MGFFLFGYSPPLVIIFILTLLISISNGNVQPTNVTPFKISVFTFGDSILDTGNNNYLPTISKSNFAPYGRDFVNHKPTGRFSNGRLVTDFIASFVGVKEYVPPYLDPNLSTEELMTGVCFASSGAGYDPLTSVLSGSMGLSRQLNLFREYKARLENAIGKERSQDSISRGVYIVSAGINDFIVNYFGVPIRRLTYPTLSSYLNFLMQNVDQFIQDLSEEGAKKIAIMGMPPIGCFPSVITVNSDHPLSRRGCIDRFNSAATNFNNLLQNKLNDVMQKGDNNLVYADFYSPIIDIIQHKSKFGFEQVSRGCCGTGLLEVIFLCNEKTPVCRDANKYLFWDSIHPTERAYHIFFDSLRPLIHNYIT